MKKNVCKIPISVFIEIPKKGWKLINADKTLSRNHIIAVIK